MLTLLGLHHRGIGHWARRRPVRCRAILRDPSIDAGERLDRIATTALEEILELRRCESVRGHLLRELGSALLDICHREGGIVGKR